MTVRKSNGLAGFGSSSRQTVSTPMPSNGSSIPLSGSSSNRPEALLGEVNAMASGSRRRVTVWNGPRATTVRESPTPRGWHWHRQVVWEWLWRSRCEWTVWRKVMADCVFQTAATVMIWFQTAKRLVISVRH